jgi:hypothetical protein
MRKLILSSAVAMAAFVVLPMSATATVLSATSNDTAKGSGSTQNFVLAGFPGAPFGPAQLSFSSVANFNGTEPRGSMKVTIGPDTFQGDVTCQMVSGNVAMLSGYVDHALGAETFAGAPANTWAIVAIDNGNSGDELALQIGPDPADPVACTSVRYEGVFEQANVDIHDG